ncbi:endolytic transglycosylase MltG [Candidatus Kaiserbacteria bacterium]|nr:endolytic transglycosylase MltG [Candidatus Kaiserbacteria bacterium]
MPTITRALERFFSLATRVQEKLSDHWRRGANQRTILVVIIVGFVSLYAYAEWFAPPSDFPIDELIAVPEGLTLEEIAGALKEQRAVKNPTALRLIVTMLGRDTSVRAGDYLFKEPKSVFSIARAIGTGAYGLEPTRVRIPEGATTKEMAKIYASRLKRIDEELFFEKAVAYEGFLFPDTYFFLPNVSEDTVIAAMRQNFDSHITEIAGEISSFGKPLKEIVVMASLLEREARIFKDRQMIAGVLWNRLDKDMLLQVDAAFLYTLGKGTFQLTMADLKSDSPYNTYKYKGLPPGPIGSPSIQSLLAAVTPVKHKYIYYLADNSGVTHYSVTYEEHLRKKNLYLGS